MHGHFPDDLIARVRESVDIVDLISSYISLRKAGTNYHALCPFHSEKSPSFVVSQAKQIFHCFGCGVGGNSISFIMKYENITFPEALRMLAERGGVALPASGQGRDEGLALLYEINREAAVFYRGRLKFSDPPSRAAEYVKKRGISPEVAGIFNLGFAPDDWDACFRYLKSRRFMPEDMERAGLIKKGSTGKYLDRFRNRLIFPISDEKGRVIAFGGRALEDGKGPKYLNSPEGALYNKSKVLYGIGEAKEDIRSVDQALVVEGYMDLISLHQAGIRNVVATAGTAFTPQHARLLSRFSRNFVMVFDGDEAGRKAAARATRTAMEQGIRPRIVMLSPGDDPDDMVRKGGKDAFLAAVREAKPYMSYLMEMACREHDVNTPEGRADAVKSILPELAEVSDPIERASYLETVSQRLGIPAAKIEATLAPAHAPGAAPARRKRPSASPVEKQLIRIILDHPEIIETRLQEIGADDFRDPVYRGIFALMKGLAATGPEKLGNLLDNADDDETKTSIRELLMRNDIYEEAAWSKSLEDCISRIKGLDRTSAAASRLRQSAKKFRH